jgi:hypothetical protein
MRTDVFDFLCFIKGHLTREMMDRIVFVKIRMPKESLSRN